MTIEIMKPIGGKKWHGLLEPVELNSKDNRSEYDYKKTNYDSQANQLLVDNLKENY